MKLQVFILLCSEKKNKTDNVFYFLIARTKNERTEFETLTLQHIRTHVSELDNVKKNRINI